MKRTTQCLVILAATFSPIPSPLLYLASAEPVEAPQFREPGQRLKLTIRLYDYADVSPKTLRYATEEVDRVFSDIGVEMSWLSCPLTMEERESNSSCSRPSTATDLVLRILPRSMYRRTTKGGDTFGFALLGKTAPRFASVLLENVQKLAWERNVNSSYGAIHQSFSSERYLGVLLGHVIAHEIGHLLLATNSHSRHGLMQTKWSASVVGRAITKRLGFRDVEAKRVREEVLRRSRGLGTD